MSGPLHGTKWQRIVWGACVILLAAAFLYVLATSKRGAATHEEASSRSRDAQVEAGGNAVLPTGAMVNRPQRREKGGFLLGPAPTLPPSSSSLASRLDSLELAAKTGDPDIGMALALALRDCLMLDSRYAQLQDDMKTGRRPAAILNAAADALDHQYEQCKGIPTQALKDYGAWIELAARRGSVAAQVAYPAIFGELLSRHSLDTAWIETYKSNSLNFLNSAASQGSIDAVRQLASVYHEGLLAPRDLELAYAYEYATFLTGEAPLSSKVLDLWGNDMTSRQIEVAQTEGEQIYKNCCT